MVLVCLTQKSLRKNTMSEIENVLAKYVAMIKNGELTNLSPLLPLLFTLRGKPFSLKDHFLWEPLFNVQVPKKRTIVCGRQVAKCILSTSKVTTYTGEHIAAADVAVGDKLLCLNENAPGWESTSGLVTNVFNNLSKPMRVITTRMGSEVTVSNDHRLRTAGGYVRSEELSVGDRICRIRRGGEFENKKVDRKRLVKWLSEDGLIGCRSHEKFIPEWVFSLSKADTITFISRLYATDGCIKSINGSPSITYCSNSRALIDGLQSLLTKLGLPSSIRFWDPEVGRRAYSLRIETRSSQDWFLNNIKVPGKPIPTGLIKKKSSNNRDTWPKDHVTSIIERHTRDTIYQRGESLRKHGLRKTLKYQPSIEKIHQYIEYFDLIGNHDAVSDLSILVDTDVYWDTIESIKEVGECDAIDFEIETHHNFVLAGGIVTHNSETSAVQMLSWQLLRDYMNILYVAPRDNQTKIFSNDKVGPYIKSSPVFKDVDKSLPNGVYTRSIKDGSNMYFSYAFLDAERIRSITAGAVFYDESLVGDTLIPTYDLSGVRTVKNISDIKAGDIVDSFTDKGCKLSSVVVCDASFHGNQPCYRVTTSSDKSVVGTSTHPLWTNEGPLRIGEMIRNVYRPAITDKENFLIDPDPDVVRDSSRRWEPINTEAQEDGELPVQTRGTSTYIQSRQIHDIVRVRNRASFTKEERELQGLILDNPPTQGLSLCVLDDIQQNHRKREPEVSEIGIKAVHGDEPGEAGRDGGPESLSVPTRCKETDDPIVKIEYVGMIDVWDIEVEGTHNYILDNGFKSLNC